MTQETIPTKSAITKAITVRSSILTVVPKSFLKPLGIDGESYLEHVLTPEGMLTRVVKLQSASETVQ